MHEYVARETTWHGGMTHLARLPVVIGLHADKPGLFASKECILVVIKHNCSVHRHPTGNKTKLNQTSCTKSSSLCICRCALLGMSHNFNLCRKAPKYDRLTMLMVVSHWQEKDTWKATTAHDLAESAKDTMRVDLLKPIFFSQAVDYKLQAFLGQELWVAVSAILSVRAQRHHTWELHVLKRRHKHRTTSS